MMPQAGRTAQDGRDRRHGSHRSARAAGSPTGWPRPATSPLRLVVRDADRAPAAARRRGGRQPRRLRRRRRASQAALAGVDTLYLVSAAEAENRLEQHFARRRRRGRPPACSGSSTRRSSTPRPTPSSPSSASTPPPRTGSGPAASAHTFLRHSMYADFVPFFATVEDGGAVIAAPGRRGPHQLRLPRRPGRRRRRRPPAGRRRPGRAGARGHRPRGDHPDRGRGRARPRSPAARPSYRDQTVEEAWATRRPSGHPDWEIEGWVTSYLAIAAGELATVTDVVPTLTGHPAPDRRRAPAPPPRGLGAPAREPGAPSIRTDSRCPWPLAYSWMT